MGLGLNDGGLGAVKYSLVQGAKSILITDLRSPEVLAKTIQQIQDFSSNYSSSIEYCLGRHRPEDFGQVDLIIKSHGVPANSSYLALAQNQSVPITTDLELFFYELQQLSVKPRLIGITGTRGKSTTTMLISHILQNYFGQDRVFTAGNIGKSVLDLIPNLKAGNYIVLELSSFQLERLTVSPHIAVFTSFFPDHLNRYNSLLDYFEAKSHIARYQGATDYCVANIDQPEIADFIQHLASQVRTYSIQNSQANLYKSNQELILNGQKILDVRDIAIDGQHNQSNVMAAILVADILKVELSSLQDSIRTFRGVAGRQELLAMVQGVEVINDTTSTMPIALYTALDTFQDKPVHLICGGENKNLSYADISAHLHPCLRSVILLPGQASLEIKQYISQVPVWEVASLKEALQKAFSLANQGDRILFSPGATSFGAYLNEFDRGNDFCQLVKGYQSKL